MTRPTRDTYFLRMAELAATRATCLRRAAGCVLVDAHGHVLATGYNGRPAGFAHCNAAEREPHTTVPGAEARVADLRRRGYAAELGWEPSPASPHDDADPVAVWYPRACGGANRGGGDGLETCEAIHAEQNALLQCADAQAIAAAYVTASPCVHCVKMLLNTGCRRVVFRERYAHDEAARELWRRADREWVHQPRDAAEG